jgi:hypothetical protein
MSSAHRAARSRAVKRPSTIKGFFPNLKAESVQPVRRLYGDNFMIDETVWTGHVVGRVLGAPGREGRASFRILHLLPRFPCQIGRPESNRKSPSRKSVVAWWHSRRLPRE